MSKRSQRRLSHTAVLGLKEMPSNAAWAVSKAFQPVAHGTASVTTSLGEGVSGLASSAAESATVGARRTANRAMDSISSRSSASRVNGSNGSVSNLMALAEQAAIRAQEKESRALALAQKAKDDATIARETSEAASAALEQAQRDADESIAARTQRAQQEADEAVAEVVREQEERVQRARAAAEHHVFNVRTQAEAAAAKELDKVSESAHRESHKTQIQAEDSETRATAAINDANEALVEAQQLADQSARVAHEAAVEATREAERLAQEATERARDAKRRAAVADQARARTAKTANVQVKTSAPVVNDEEQLSALTKQNLVGFATELELEGATAMNKRELVEILADEGVPFDLLTKRDLLRLAESQGLEVRSSMSKPDLIASIS